MPVQITREALIGNGKALTPTELSALLQKYRHVGPWIRVHSAAEIIAHISVSPSGLQNLYGRYGINAPSELGIVSPAPDPHSSFDIQDVKVAEVDHHIAVRSGSV